jgi:hypothetical protein
MEGLSPAQIRRRLEEDISSGSYRRPEGHLSPQGWFSGSDMRKLSSDYKLKAAYTVHGSHWRLMLDYKKIGDEEYTALVYDPLQGVVETRIKGQRDVISLELSPELEKEYWKKRDEGIVIHHTDGSTQHLSEMEFLEDYFSENPTPREVITLLHRRGKTQKDSYNCGPLTISAAHAIKEYSSGNLDIEELDEIIIGEPINLGDELDIKEIPDDELIIGKPRNVGRGKKNFRETLAGLRKKLER